MNTDTTEPNTVLDNATQFVQDNLMDLCKEVFEISQYGSPSILNNRQAKIHELAHMLSKLTNMPFSLARAMTESAAVRKVAYG